MDTSSTPPSKPPVIKVEPGVPKPNLQLVPKPTPKEAPLDAFQRLKQFVKAVNARHQEVEDLFKEKPELSPTKNPEFKKFVSDTLAEVSMRYVMFGSFKPAGDSEAAPTGPEAIEQQMKENGFNVSAQEIDRLDPALRSNPAALLALSSGADLAGDREEVSERLT